MRTFALVTDETRLRSGKMNEETKRLRDSWVGEEPNNDELYYKKSGANPAVRKCRSVVAASRTPRCFMQAKLVQSVKENAWSS